MKQKFDNSGWTYYYGASAEAQHLRSHLREGLRIALFRSATPKSTPEDNLLWAILEDVLAAGLARQRHSKPTTGKQRTKAKIAQMKR